ncbi:hypothetical protein RUND412_005671 [Rhizina undulata]
MPQWSFEQEEWLFRIVALSFPFNIDKDWDIISIAFEVQFSGTWSKTSLMAKWDELHSRGVNLQYFEQAARRFSQGSLPVQTLGSHSIISNSQLSSPYRSLLSMPKSLISTPEPTPELVITNGNRVKYTHDQIQWIAQNVPKFERKGRYQWALVALEYTKEFHQDQRPLSLMQKWNELVNTSGGPEGFLTNNPPIKNEDMTQASVKSFNTRQKRRGLPLGGKRYTKAEED